MEVKVLDWLKRCAVQVHNLEEMVAGAVRTSKSDIVLSTLAFSLYTEWQGHIGRSTIGRTRARGWADFQSKIQ